MFDYVGWILFSQGSKEKLILFLKHYATHMATGMISLLGHDSFQQIYIQNNLYLQMFFRACFVLTDSIVRSYYLLCIKKLLIF